MSSIATPCTVTTPLISRRCRAYYAPVIRSTTTPTIFDPALGINWDCKIPSTPWVDLGYIEAFSRAAESKTVEVVSGMPALVRLQAKQSFDATVSFRFATWSKLSMALSSGSEHMNVLATGGATTPTGSGGKALPALALTSASTASTLYPATTPSPGFQVGCMVIVDQDYTGQVGYIGAPYSAAYVSEPGAIGNDQDYIRRVSFNVARITAIGTDGSLSLGAPLPAGAPSPGMKMQQAVAFLDREGGSFFHEWSALFVHEGVQGDRLILHYPRLQSCQSAAEATVKVAETWTTIHPASKFRALPVIDGNDGQQVLCYRTYYPGTSSPI